MAIVESSDDAIIGKSLDSVIRSWNSGARRMFGYEPEDFVFENYDPHPHIAAPVAV